MRIYLPTEDLTRFGVCIGQLRTGVEDERFRELMRFEGARARSYYEESAALLRMIHPKSRASLWALREIYLSLLSRLERSDYSVLTRRINVPTSTKLGILLKAFLRRNAPKRARLAR